MSNKTFLAAIVCAGIAFAGTNEDATIHIDMAPATDGIQTTIEESNLNQEFSVGVWCQDMASGTGAQIVLAINTDEFEIVSGDNTNGVFNVALSSIPADPGPEDSELTVTYGTFSGAVVSDMAFLGTFTLKSKLAYGESGQLSITVDLGASSTDRDILSATGIYSVVLPQYSITVSSDGNGTVDPSSVTVDHGVASGDITATPSSCYAFDSWSTVTGDPVIADASSATTTVSSTTGDAEIQANFVRKTYTLTVNSDEDGGAAGGGTVNCGEDSDITATANDGFAFLNWTVESGTATLADANAASTTVSITEDATIMAHFQVADYTLSIDNNGNGTVDATPSVQHGVATDITAADVPDMNFVNWTISGNGTLADANSAATTVTLVGDATVTANFEAITHTLTIDNNGDGNADATETVNQGADFDISAGTIEGKTFTNWTVTEGGTVAEPTSVSTTVSLTADATVTAHFSDVVYTLTVVAADNGTVSPTGDVSVAYEGDPVDIEATADEGYKFDGWVVTGDATVADANSAATSVTVTGDATVTASFSQIVTYMLTIEAGDNGSVDPSGDVTVEEGADPVSIVATPDQDCRFVAWEITEGEGNATIADTSAATTTITVTGDVTIKATFEPSTSVQRAASMPESYGCSVVMNGLRYRVPAEGRNGTMRISLISPNGAIVRTYTMHAIDAGYYSLDFLEGNQSIGSGYYICTVRSASFQKTLRVLINK